MRRIISLSAIVCFGFITSTAMGSTSPHKGPRHQPGYEADDEESGPEGGPADPFANYDVSAMELCSTTQSGDFNECFSPGGVPSAPRANRRAEAVKNAVTGALEHFEVSVDGINSLFVRSEAGGTAFTVMAKAIELGERRRLSAVFSALIGQKWNELREIEELTQSVSEKILEVASSTQFDQAELAAAIELAKFSA